MIARATYRKLGVEDRVDHMVAFVHPHHVPLLLLQMEKIMRRGCNMCAYVKRITKDVKP